MTQSKPIYIFHCLDAPRIEKLIDKTYVLYKMYLYLPI